jgi:anti-sigma regulatory factor (Ser/Thr protein kinase)/anti-anti-sigma regulatory factor
VLNALSLSLPPVPTAGQVARAAIRDGFTGTVAPETLADLELVISELVTNAIEHGEGEIELRLDHDAGALRGSVSDQGHGFRYELRPLDGGQDQPRGRGLSIVNALVTRWGIEAGSTRVWFEIAAGARTVRPDRPLYEVELVRQETALRIVLKGEFDLAAKPALEGVLRDLDPAGLERVVVDIREVTFFDTTGLNMATRLDRWGLDHGLPVSFTRGGPAVANALEAAGLALALTFTDVPEDQLPPRGR